VLKTRFNGKKYLFIGLLCLVTIVVFLLLTTKLYENKEDKLSNTTFISSSYSNDSYLTYVYSSENLPFNLTYRKIDFYSNLYILHKFYGYNVENYKFINESLNNFSEWSNSQSFSNTIIRTGMPTLALDTYCIVKYYRNDSNGAKKILDYITEDYNIMADNYYTQDVWRNIADETWCVMLIKKTNINDSLSKTLLSIKLKEGRSFLLNDSYDEISKAGIVLHELYLLKEFEGYQQEKNFWIDKAFYYLSQEEILQNNLMLSDFVDILLEYNITKKDVEKFVDLLNSRKNSNGYWDLDQNVTTKRFQIFTTSRVLIALAHFNERFKNEK